MNTDAISWFEIPVRDLERAQRFYENVLDRKLKRETMGEEQLAIFPAAEGRAQGCINIGPNPVAPSSSGTRVYLDVSPSIDAALSRVADAGGKVVTRKTALPPGLGFWAHVSDTEGNVVGLHALN
jgi:predicted enzyme related to lactoylglutathione lyase